MKKKEFTKLEFNNIITLVFIDKNNTLNWSFYLVFSYIIVIKSLFY